MKKKEVGYNFFLEAEQIDTASEKIIDYLTEIGLEHKEALRIQFSIEDILLKWQNRFGKMSNVQLSCYSRLGQQMITLKLDGDPYDPISKDDEDDQYGEWSQKLLSGLKTTPLYSYSHNLNIVTFKVMQKKRNSFLTLLISIAAAIVIGLLGSLLPVEFRTNIAEGLMEPICSTYLNVLGFCGIPLIFLSVALGIVGVGDINIFQKIGKKMVLDYIATLFGIVVITAMFTFPLFSFTYGESAISLNYTNLLEMILGWLPINLIQPFIDCNAMQLIIMGAVFGIGLLKLDPLAKNMLKVLDDLNSFLLLVGEWFTHIIPIFVFIIIVKSFWAGEISSILKLWKPWVVTVGFQSAIMLFLALWICFKYKVNLIKLLKKVSETFFIALGTNSCTASIMENYACCGGKLGIAGSVFGFGIPIGTSIFKPCSAIRFVVLSYFMVSLYNINVSSGWFIMVIILSFMLSIAVPAIPGGVLMFCPMLFAQLGIPEEALITLLATDVFFDFICTAFNQVAVQFALVNQAGRMDMLDKGMLKS